jgi:hypothetical protein
VAGVLGSLLGLDAVAIVLAVVAAVATLVASWLWPRPEAPERAHRPARTVGV